MCCAFLCSQCQINPFLLLLFTFTSWNFDQSGHAPLITLMNQQFQPADPVHTGWKMTTTNKEGRKDYTVCPWAYICFLHFDVWCEYNAKLLACICTSCTSVTGWLDNCGNVQALQHTGVPITMDRTCKKNKTYDANQQISATFTKTFYMFTYKKFSLLTSTISIKHFLS